MRFDIDHSAETLDYFERVENALKKIILSGKLVDKKIAVVGCWHFAKQINQIINSFGLEISYFGDNSKDRQNVEKCGIITQSVDSFKNLNFDTTVVFVANKIYEKELCSQLISLGFELNVNLFALSEKNNPENKFYTDSEFSEIKNKITKAFAWYENLTEKYSDMPIWIMPPSLGEFNFFSLMLPVYMGKNSIQDCDIVIVVFSNSTKKYAEHIGYKNVELISYKDNFDSLCYFVSSMGDKLTSSIFIIYDFTYQYKMLFKSGYVTLLDFIAKFIFGFKNIPEFIPFRKTTDRNELEKLFETNRLTIGKTVLIAPYASHFVLKNFDWTELVNKLIEKGYTVCTNCGKDTEKPLENTVGIRIELKDIVAFSEVAGGFIGIRSGLCDILSSADCKKIILYEAGDTSADTKLFGFENMGLANENLIEFTIDSKNSDTIIHSILEEF